MNYDPARIESGQQVKVCNACKTGAIGTGVVSKVGGGSIPCHRTCITIRILSTFPVQRTCP